MCVDVGLIKPLDSISYVDRGTKDMMTLQSDEMVSFLVELIMR